MATVRDGDTAACAPRPCRLRAVAAPPAAVPALPPPSRPLRRARVRIYTPHTLLGSLLPLTYIVALYRATNAVALPVTLCDGCNARLVGTADVMDCSNRLDDGCLTVLGRRYH